MGRLIVIVLNNLRPHTAEHHTNKEIIKELICIPHMNSNFRKNKMSNARIQQIITLLYMHKKMVRSEGVALYESGELKKLIRRNDRNSNYYKTNKLVQGTFKFLGLVVGFRRCNIAVDEKRYSFTVAALCKRCLLGFSINGPLRRSFLYMKNTCFHVSYLIVGL